MDRAPRGSSPHTRGAQRPVRVARPGLRIIPAYAGSTASCGSGFDAHADHPRIRGEHRSNCACRRAQFGSSPHTRGARTQPAGARQADRIIPAYAGSTAPRRTGRFGRTDHPRIRGEHGKARELRFHTPGSSPHTRGALPRAGGQHRRRGIIPAYAGSTVSVHIQSARPKDHPRIRGEHLLTTMSMLKGIIPAYAGSTRPGRSRCACCPDHPRIRGEHRAAPTCSGGRSWIIPAYAGSTRRGPRASR